MPVRILVTGFEPFGGSTLNPSQAVVDAIESGTIRFETAEVHTALLPVDTLSIEAVVEALWKKFDPDIVLHLGESAKADRLTLERVALNLLDFDAPDNAGRVVVDESIDPDGPPARFATLPVRTLRDRLAEQGIDAELSLSAGAYLCNQTLYLSLAQAQQRGGRAVGFVHVPSLQEQVERGERKVPAMAREQLIQQANRLIEHTIQAFDSAQYPGGH
jgi:pyroglutamyl-peptidase